MYLNLVELMKLIFCVLLMFGSSAAYGQNMQLLSYKASNGVEYKSGMLVHLGQGTGVDRCFRYIDSNYVGTSGKTNLPSTYQGQFIEIRKIRQSGSKKEGYKIYLICKTGPKNYWVDLEAGIQAGEIVLEP